MDLLQPLILTALICLIVGFALGYLTGSGRTSKDERLPGGETPVRRAISQPSASPFTAAKTPPPAHQQGSAALLARTGPRPNLNPVDVIARALQPERARSAAPKSIAAQVDEILQEKLAQASLAETRAVRLVDVPGKGVVVKIGVDAYEGVESVPDAGIRELIRASVEDWEKRAPQI